MCEIALLYTAFIRQNAIGMIYYCFLLFILYAHKTTVNRIWRPWIMFTAVMFFIQYCCAIGLPPGYEKYYPWELTATRHNSYLRWLYLPPITPVTAPGLSEPSVWMNFSVYSFALLFLMLIHQGPYCRFRSPRCIKFPHACYNTGPDILTLARRTAVELCEE